MKNSILQTVIIVWLIIIVYFPPVYMYDKHVEGLNSVSNNEPWAIPFQLCSKFDDIEIITQHSSATSPPVPTKLLTESLSSKKTYINRHVSKTFKRLDIINHGRSDVASMHKVIFVVKQSNIEELERFVLDISEPNSKNFGKFKTREEITALTSHTASTSYIVRFFKSFWKGKHFVIEKSSYGEFISGNYWSWIKIKC